MIFANQSFEVIIYIKLIAIINVTKIKKCLGSPKMIYTSKLTINSSNKAHNNYEYNKNKEMSRPTRNCLYNKTQVFMCKGWKLFYFYIAYASDFY